MPVGDTWPPAAGANQRLSPGNWELDLKHHLWLAPVGCVGLCGVKARPWREREEKKQKCLEKAGSRLAVWYQAFLSRSYFLASLHFLGSANNHPSHSWPLFPYFGSRGSCSWHPNDAWLGGGGSNRFMPAGHMFVEVLCAEHCTGHWDPAVIRQTGSLPSRYFSWEKGGRI